MPDNGRLPKSMLAPIPGGELRKDAARGWNASAGPADAGCLPTGPRSSYRTIAEQEQLYKELGARMAAVPGTSNHGLGIAIDLREPWMRAWIDEHGLPYGWAKTEAFHEWWHVNFTGNVTVSLVPTLSRGSRGKRVARYTRRLAFVRRPHRNVPYLKGGGRRRFGKRVESAVETFQRDHGLAVDGAIGKRTAAKIDAVFTRQWQNRKQKARRGTNAGTAAASSVNEVAIANAIKAPAPKHSKWRLDFAAPFIAKWEGFLEFPYLDTIAEPDIWTAGYGHIGDDVVPGERWSKAKALRVLTRDIRWAAKAVTRNVHVPLTYRQRIALISLVFNCGPGAIQGSTLQRLLNRRDYLGAADELLRWSHAGEVVVQGLLNRRSEERAMFLSRPERWRKWQKH